MTGAAGPRVLVVEHEAGCPLGRLAAPLRSGPQGRRGVTLDLRRPWRGEALPAGSGALDGVDALAELARVHAQVLLAAAS